MNLLTFDVEDWYHINYPIIDFSDFDRQEDHQDLFGHVQKLTEICRRTGAQGTFFVLARLLEKRPQIGEWIIDQGHELALHGYEHDLLYEKEPDQFKKELEHSIEIFHRITGKYPLGYRAPSWSINLSNLWVLEILESFGFIYDASIFPIKNFLYGLPSAPSGPFYPVIGGRQLGLLEVPVPIARLGSQRIAYSGGVYFNLWPFPVTRKLAARQILQGGINLFYFHPWDLWRRSPDQCRRLKSARWVTIHLGDSMKKFKKLLATFPLGNIFTHLAQLKERAPKAFLGRTDEPK
jgi:polysaccharide deacetylase family protein (PEP-CTERM system associated)